MGFSEPATVLSPRFTITYSKSPPSRRVRIARDRAVRSPAGEAMGLRSEPRSEIACSGPQRLGHETILSHSSAVPTCCGYCRSNSFRLIAKRCPFAQKVGTALIADRCPAKNLRFPQPPPFGVRSWNGTNTNALNRVSLRRNEVTEAIPRAARLPRFRWSLAMTMKQLLCRLL